MRPVAKFPTEGSWSVLSLPSCVLLPPTRLNNCHETPLLSLPKYIVSSVSCTRAQTAMFCERVETWWKSACT